MQTEKEQEGTDSLHPPEAWQKKDSILARFLQMAWSQGLGAGIFILL